MTFDEAMEATKTGAHVTNKGFGKGWYVWRDGPSGQLYSHNPYHGAHPSMCDHQYAFTAADQAATWLAASQ